jgi:integrase
VKPKKTAVRDAERLVAHVYPLVGKKLVADFTLDDAEKVMQALPRKTVRTPATRRHYAQLIHRILGLAVFPLRLIKVNPLPKGFLPKVGPAKAKGWLYPDEDAKLCGATAVPLCSRLFYGFLNREGPRLGEAAAMDLCDVDLERGAVRLDENKTDDPRAWALDPGVIRALRAWIAHREALAGAPLPRTAPLFVGEDGERIRGDDFHAKRFRAHLLAAGIDRVELFERSASRMHIRLHDTRATFVTLALANGKTETWVADRTGHKSSDMINKYRRAARTAAELGLGPLRPLDEVLPELAVRRPPAPGREGGGHADGAPPPPAADPIGAAAARAQARAHADLNVAKRGVPPPETLAELDVSQQLGASLNPLIMVRVHAPELGLRRSGLLPRLPSGASATGATATSLEVASSETASTRNEASRGRGAR